RSGGQWEKEIGIHKYKDKYKYNVKWNECGGNSTSCTPELEFRFPEVVNAVKIGINIKAPKRVRVKAKTKHRRGTNRGLMPRHIKGVTIKNGELYFLVKWNGSGAEDVVLAAEMNAKYPQTVIRYYESIFHLT
ncbi:unnamed protein product, partial [Hymenolepis diminuta]